MIRVVALVAMLGGCTPQAMPLTANHPANPAAPIGRLAGPPPALRPGVAAPPTQEAPSAPQPAPAAQQGHQGHQ